MSRRSRKITPKSSKVATISTILELPDAIFYGDAINDPDALSSAVRLQTIRTEYEAFGDITALWHDLSELDFCPGEISQCVSNPANITSCAYGWPSPGLR